ncbi:MAG: hypothetical protein ACOZQL_36710 [Myxococcota bacterium]
MSPQRCPTTCEASTTVSPATTPNRVSPMVPTTPMKGTINSAQSWK